MRRKERRDPLYRKEKSPIRGRYGLATVGPAVGLTPIDRKKGGGNSTLTALIIGEGAKSTASTKGTSSAPEETSPNKAVGEKSWSGKGSNSYFPDGERAQRRTRELKAKLRTTEG